MPTHYTGRVTLIVVVALVFLAAIFGPLIQHPSWTFDRSIPFLRKTNILPGIDMVGGTSLLYEIRTPADRPTRVADLDVQMMNALKRRVDPDGVRNLIWRPQGGNRLEIQMPLSGKGDAGDADKKRNDLLAARAALEANNVNRADVIAAVEAQGGPDRTKLQTLAGGSRARLELFNQLADAFQAVGKAHAAKDAAAQAAAQIRYDELKGKVQELNVTAEQLESILPKPDPAAGGNVDPKVAAENRLRQSQYGALKARLAGFPKQLETVENYRKVFDEFNKVRAQIDDVGELKRLLKGAGVLEFHILAVPPSMNRGGDEKSNISDAEFAQWVERLTKQ